MKITIDNDVKPLHLMIFHLEDFPLKYSYLGHQVCNKNSLTGGKKEEIV